MNRVVFFVVGCFWKALAFYNYGSGLVFQPRKMNKFFVSCLTSFINVQVACFLPTPNPCSFCYLSPSLVHPN
jgi:hypothetical protein